MPVTFPNSSFSVSRRLLSTKPHCTAWSRHSSLSAFIAACCWASGWRLDQRGAAVKAKDGSLVFAKVDRIAERTDVEGKLREIGDLAKIRLARVNLLDKVVDDGAFAADRDNPVRLASLILQNGLKSRERRGLCFSLRQCRLEAGNPSRERARPRQLGRNSRVIADRTGGQAMARTSRIAASTSPASLRSLASSQSRNET